MKPLPVQKRALAKRAALIDAATASFSELGYEATTSKTIAARAGVATGSFYQYFDNKDELLAVIAQQRFDYLRLNLESEPEVDAPASIEAAFHRVLDFIYDFHEQDRNLHIVLEQRRFVDPQLAEILETGDASLERRVIAFVSGFELDEPEATAFTLIAMAEGLVHRHVFSPSQHASREQVIRLGSQLLSSYFQSLLKD